MFIDIFFIALMFLAVSKGINNGLIRSLFSFIAFFVGLAAAIKLSVFLTNYLSANFNAHGKWLPFISFILIFASFVILFFYLGKFFEKTTEILMLGWLNKFGGVCLYMLLYGIMYSVILFYGKQMNLISVKYINKSIFYPYVEPLGPLLIDSLGKIIPLFKDLFLQLEQYFDEIPNKIN
jgi:membrane protein required for colicin V production